MPTPVPPSAREQLQQNLQLVHDRIARASEVAGRSADEVRLIAVTKSAAPELAAEFITLGQLDLAENRPQQLLERAQLLEHSLSSQQYSAARPRWHLIGQLQRNKVRAVLPRVELIHSVDSLRLLQKISQTAAELSLTPAVLLQVNVSGEKSKSGFTPDELRSQWNEIAQFPHLRIDGLMTMAPETDIQQVIRDTFRGLRELRDELRSLTPLLSLPELSMGMSSDFEIAIEEGATLVRLGSVLFEGCSPGNASP